MHIRVAASWRLNMIMHKVLPLSFVPYRADVNCAKLFSNWLTFTGCPDAKVDRMYEKYDKCNNLGFSMY